MFVCLGSVCVSAKCHDSAGRRGIMAVMSITRSWLVGNWCSNFPRLLKRRIQFPQLETEIENERKCDVKVIGLHWNEWICKSNMCSCNILRWSIWMQQLPERDKACSSYAVPFVFQVQWHKKASPYQYMYLVCNTNASYSFNLRRWHMQTHMLPLFLSYSVSYFQCQHAFLKLTCPFEFQQ